MNTVTIKKMWEFHDPTSSFEDWGTSAWDEEKMSSALFHIQYDNECPDKWFGFLLTEDNDHLEDIGVCRGYADRLGDPMTSAEMTRMLETATYRVEWDGDSSMVVAHMKIVMMLPAKYARRLRMLRFACDEGSTTISNKQTLGGE
jgi:hypothetical protein